MTLHASTTLGDCHARIGRVWDRLAITTDGHTRAKLLIEAADLELEMAQLHRADPDGGDTCERLTMLARLLDVLADVELVACGCLSQRVATSTDFEDVAGAILDTMAATADPSDRAHLLAPLAAALAEHADGYLAELLHGLPYAPDITGRHQQPRSAIRKPLHPVRLLLSRLT